MQYLGSQYIIVPLMNAETFPFNREEIASIANIHPLFLENL